MTQPTDAHIDITASIIAFEDGTLSDPDTLTMFAHLANIGLVYQLQGFYGRTFDDLTSNGLITRDPTTHLWEPDFDRLNEFLDQ